MLFMWLTGLSKSLQSFNKLMVVCTAFSVMLLSSCASTQSTNSDDVLNEGKQIVSDKDIAQRISEIQAKYKKQADIEQSISTPESYHIDKLLLNADAARQSQHWSEAQSLYQNVIELDVNNEEAQQGLNAAKLMLRHKALLEQAESMLANEDVDGALLLIRTVLAENSTNAKARMLYEKIEEEKLGKALTSEGLRAEFKKNITLEFKKTPLKSVFEFMSETANINFTFDKDVELKQKTSIFVRDTSIEEALRILLLTNHLEKKVLNDNSVLIYPLSRHQDYQELFVRSFYLSNMDAKRALALIKTVLKTQDVYIDEQLNTLVMRDTPEHIAMAEKLITSQDLAEPEVMLEVEVMEVSHKSMESIGMQYPTSIGIGVHGSSDISNNAGTLTLNELKHFNSDMGLMTITDPVFALNLLSQDTETNLLASPQIRVKNREKARIHIGDKIPVITSTANSTGFVSESVTYLDVGVKLDVQPTILLNNEVSIWVALEVSNQTDQVKTSSGTLTYTLGTRNASTVLRLKNGETQVLAGLFRDDEQKTTNKVPGLSRLPFIGKLFTDKTTDTTKKEIVLLITPRILSNIKAQDIAYTNFAAGTDNLETNKNGRNARGEQPNYSSYSSQQPVPSPEQTQSGSAQVDRSFADSVINSQ